ncbi:antibiotic biosynthesis monooxygenase family protein [Dictyobacter formicarum]|uniref:ABM domain-containing protein n=1 Tax=Dictyobacter formicarum TaxID=2778368 RepID=A0ABQ3VEC8_9CHLR|nr:antibiotic biosynthesis monooxygenase family protein [Dictyobacter formicarum]GHO84512.1 hypothetical protein KSZ_25180 [Dictyobacter formicarum]
MQHSTELLVVTLAHVLPGKDTEARAHIRSIADTLRSAPGLISTRLYRGRGNGIVYLLLTTWEDEQSWLKAQERHTPKKLLLTATNLLVSQPEQWLLYYLWGYSRPTAPAQLASVHIMTIEPQKIEQVQKQWLAGLYQPELQTNLTFAFFARGINDTPTAHKMAAVTHATTYQEIFAQQSSLLFVFFSWANEMEREDFYAQEIYQQVKKIVERTAPINVLSLEML